VEQPRHNRIAIRITRREKEALREIAWERRTTMSALIRAEIERLISEGSSPMDREGST